jgi:biofilm protein TabA
MIVSNLTISDKYNHLNAKIQKSIEYLNSSDLVNMPDGKYEIEADDIFANFMTYETVTATEVDFETHNRYIDIQYIITGQEVFGIAPRALLIEKDAYSDQKDITFYADPAEYSRIILNAGDYVILMPEDAHKPKLFLNTPGAVKKVVVKVKI